MNRQEVFDWCRQRYGSEPDYPWNDWNAVLRHTDNNKWYGVIIEVDRSKLGIDGNGVVDILNVKCDPTINPIFQYHITENRYEDGRYIIDGCHEQVQNLSHSLQKRLTDNGMPQSQLNQFIRKEAGGESPLTIRAPNPVSDMNETSASKSEYRGEAVRT